MLTEILFVVRNFTQTLDEPAAGFLVGQATPTGHLRLNSPEAASQAKLVRALHFWHLHKTIELLGASSEDILHI